MVAILAGPGKRVLYEARSARTNNGSMKTVNVIKGKLGVGIERYQLTDTWGRTCRTVAALLVYSEVLVPISVMTSMELMPAN